MDGKAIKGCKSSENIGHAEKMLPCGNNLAGMLLMKAFIVGPIVSTHSVSFQDQYDLPCRCISSIRALIV